MVARGRECPWSCGVPVVALPWPCPWSRVPVAGGRSCRGVPVVWRAVGVAAAPTPSADDAHSSPTRPHASRARPRALRLRARLPSAARSTSSGTPASTSAQDHVARRPREPVEIENWLTSRPPPAPHGGSRRSPESQHSRRPDEVGAPRCRRLRAATIRHVSLRVVAPRRVARRVVVNAPRPTPASRSLVGPRAGESLQSVLTVNSAV
jgi:hypothetical protein